MKKSEHFQCNKVWNWTYSKKEENYVFFHSSKRHKSIMPFEVLWKLISYNGKEKKEETDCQLAQDLCCLWHFTKFHIQIYFTWTQTPRTSRCVALTNWKVTASLIQFSLFCAPHFLMLLCVFFVNFILNYECGKGFVLYHFNLSLIHFSFLVF